MMECVPFMAVEDEPRIAELVKGWIEAGEVPEYKLFTEEPKAKRQRRHKKYAREALEARELKREREEKAKREQNGGGDASLQQLILARQANRAAQADNFFDALMAKYGGADDSEDFYIPAKKTKKKATATAKAKKNGKGSDRRVKSGRVSK